MVLEGQMLGPEPDMMSKRHRNRWLELVIGKCKAFLHKMGKDAKTETILQKPYQYIGHTITNIYNQDGKSLMKWINEEYPLDSIGGDNKEKSDINITSCKEKFKSMLSLDIWIEKLAQWQASGYKLEMPKREMVDSLRWHTILSQKLKQAIRGNPDEPRPPPSQGTNPKMSVQEEMYIRGMEPRKRKY